MKENGKSLSGLQRRCSGPPSNLSANGRGIMSAAANDQNKRPRDKQQRGQKVLKTINREDDGDRWLIDQEQDV